MKYENVVCAIIVTIVIVLFMLAMANSARAHDDHLEYIKEYVVQGSYDGKQFKTVDDICWEVYKAPHGNITSYSRLHVREVDCNDKQK